MTTDPAGDDGVEATRPPPLDYARPLPRRPVQIAVQGLLGAVAWFVLMAGAVGVGQVIDPDDAWVVIGCGLGAAAGAIVGGGVVQDVTGWRGFLAGVLIGMGVTCLVPVGIVAYLCGIGWR